MVPELGHFALILALFVAVAQGAMPLWGAHSGNLSLIKVARPAASLQFGLLLLSFVCLSFAFYHNDFTVLYVAQNSNSQLPWFYRLSAVWGAHEGSFLLWTLIMAGWTLAVAVFSRQLPETAVARVLGVMGIISVGFIAFLLFTSNPFERTLPNFPIDGADLNPLLQDPGLIIHPPMLYMGYVGFSVAFAFAVAALLSGQLDSTWARWSRPWTTVAWAFLTVGIALGSWWAYYELGWGGWWFWDPVENASFMPWLAGTALIHSLAVSEKRGVFKRWTLLLALTAFSLSLLGAFLVRSGVLTSVHSFAADPERGLFILLFLLLVVGGSLALFAFRASTMKSLNQFEPVSREVGILLNNILLMGALAVVFLGTLYPLIADALNLGKVSVGPPYFDFLFSILMVPILILLAVGPALRWKRHSFAAIQKDFRWIAAASILLGLLIPLGLSSELTSGYRWSLALAFALVSWVLFATLRDVRNKTSRKGWSAGLAGLSRSYYGMVIAHLGVIVCVLGVVIVNVMDVERDVRLEPGQSVEEAGYRFEFVRLNELQGPNYLATQATFDVYSDGQFIATLQPEKRRYLASGQVMTEADISGNLWRDLYVSLGEPISETAWAVRVYYKPLVRWIWLGALLMALGGGLAISDKRYRLKVRQKVAQTWATEEQRA